MAEYVKPVVFKVNNELYGVDINSVQSIEKQIQVVSVPNAVSYIRGIINLRGEVIPVYSFKRKFKQDDSKFTGNAIIINVGSVKIALEVDEVMEISDIDTENIMEMPRIVRNKETIYMDKVANVNGKLIILINVNILLSREEKENLKRSEEHTSELQSP